MNTQGAGPEVALGDAADFDGNGATVARHADGARVLRGDHCRCGSCGQWFNCTKAFDRHRVGDYPGRRCLSIAEMRVRGMTINGGGWWITESRETHCPTIRRASGSGDQHRASP
jgi:hypothetical protein